MRLGRGLHDLPPEPKVNALSLAAEHQQKRALHKRTQTSVNQTIEVNGLAELNSALAFGRVA